MTCKVCGAEVTPGQAFCGRHFVASQEELVNATLDESPERCLNCKNVCLDGVQLYNKRGGDLTLVGSVCHACTSSMTRIRLNVDMGGSTPVLDSYGPL